MSFASKSLMVSYRNIRYCLFPHMRYPCSWVLTTVDWTFFDNIGVCNEHLGRSFRHIVDLAFPSQKERKGGMRGEAHVREEGERVSCELELQLPLTQRMPCTAWNSFGFLKVHARKVAQQQHYSNKQQLGHQSWKISETRASVLVLASARHRSRRRCDQVGPVLDLFKPWHQLEKL